MRVSINRAETVTEKRPRSPAFYIEKVLQSSTVGVLSRSPCSSMWYLASYLPKQYRLIQKVDHLDALRCQEFGILLCFLRRS